MKISTYNKIKYLPDVFLGGIASGWVYFFINDNFINTLVFAVMIGPAVVTKMMIYDAFKPKYVCPNCDECYNNRFLIKYCQKCGTKLEKIDYLKSDIVCDSCGEKVLNGNKFCTQCGTEIKEKYDKSL